MKALLTLCLSLLACVPTYAQIFWNENFETGAATGLEVASYSSVNGSWTLTVTGTEGARPNRWYVSCEEAGHIAGDCGSTCTSSFGLGASLHVGADPILIGDAGATYDAGGLFNTTTTRRAESPTINCTGHSNITLRFYYIENGQGTSDDGSVWYYDGATWSVLVNTSKTTTCGGGQGVWAQYVMTLPSSADNNPNVKIGFEWVNNNDGAGTDPSFAVDSVTLSTVAGPTVPTPTFTQSSATICQDSCVTFTNTTSGTIDSFRWAVVGTPLTANTSPLVLCPPSSLVPAGAYTMRLYVFLGGAVDSASSSFTINAAPHPVITRTGNTFSVSGTYSSYAWYNGATAIAGATNASYTTTVKGSYSVVVDSGGCKGSATISTLAASQINNNGQHFWISNSGSNAVNLYSSEPLEDALTVTVYDATGRKMYNGIWPAGLTSKQFATDILPAGIYILRLGNGNTSVTLRWLKR